MFQYQLPVVWCNILCKLIVLCGVWGTTRPGSNELTIKLEND